MQAELNLHAIMTLIFFLRENLDRVSSSGHMEGYSASFLYVSIFKHGILLRISTLDNTGVRILTKGITEVHILNEVN